MPKIFVHHLAALWFAVLGFNWLACHPLYAQVINEVEIEENEPAPTTSTLDSPESRKLNAALELLAQNEIEPTRPSISHFLTSLHPDHPDVARRLEEARRLIRELGSDNFQERLQAYQKLRLMHRLPIEEVQAAINSTDPEVRFRASQLLERLRHPKRSDSIGGLVEAISTVVRNKKIEGLTQELFQVTLIVDAGTSDDRITFSALSSAVVETATMDDLAFTQAMLTSTNTKQKLFAIAVLANLTPDRLPEDLSPLLDDDSLIVQLSAARELMNIGDRNALRKLIQLLTSDEINVRAESNRMLKSVTGQDFGFVAYADKASRTESADLWLEWATGPGSQQDLNIPIVDQRHEIGRILISDYSANELIEYNWLGEEVWRHGVTRPWGVQGLANGHRVVSTYSPSAIIEFDHDGEEVWRIDDVPGNAMGIHRLDNGNTLVASSSTNQVLEYTPEGELAWSATLEGRVVDVQRLDTGNTLATLIADRKVVEIDTEGHVVWEVTVEGQPLTAFRSSDGMTLVSCNEQQAAIEFDLNGHIVREFECKPKCTAARILGNGSILVTSNTTASLLTEDGELIWERSGMTLCYGANNY